MLWVDHPSSCSGSFEMKTGDYTASRIVMSSRSLSVPVSTEDNPTFADLSKHPRYVDPFNEKDENEPDWVKEIEKLYATWAPFKPEDFKIREVVGDLQAQLWLEGQFSKAAIALGRRNPPNRVYWCILNAIFHHKPEMITKVREVHATQILNAGRSMPASAFGDLAPGAEDDFGWH